MSETKKRILIADDDREIREVLTLLLTGEGYEVLACEDGVSALSRAADGVDLFILDVNMPGKTGFATAADIRRQSGAPIIFLTAYSGESDKVMGFQVGADDYMVKPFSNAELLARVRAVLRRAEGIHPNNPPAPPAHLLPLGDLYLDTESLSVLRGEERIPLTHTEYKILELMVRNPKRIFSPEHIYTAVWEENAVGDAAIMVHIKNVRKKLGDDSRNPRYIKTAWGRGYYVD